MGRRIIVQGADFSAYAINGGGVIYYNVTLSLSNAAVSNTATRVAAGSTYSVTVTPAVGYELQSVTVTHNGRTVAPTSGYTYRISSVAGPITVTAMATEGGGTPSVDYLVTYSLTNAVSSTSAASVPAGSSFSVTLTPATGCNGFRSVEVIHNGVAVTPTSGNTYTIPSVAGPISVTAVGCMTYTTANATLNEGYVVCETVGSRVIGEIVSNTSYSYTELIPCSGFSTIASINHPNHAALFYDASSQPLSGWVRGVEGNAETEETFQIPSGAAYVRCNTFDAGSRPASTYWHVILY